MNRINASFLAHQVIGVIALLLFLATPVALAQAARTPISASTESGVRIEPVPSKLYIPPDAQNGRFAAVPAFRGSGIGQVDYHISAITPDSTTSSAPGGPRKTGVVYVLPDPIKFSTLRWERANDGFAARIRIIADQSQSLRIHLSFVDQSPLVEIRVQGNQDAIPLGPILGAAVRDREIWLPITLGGEAVLELFFPTEEAMQSGEFQVDLVNYIFGANDQFGQFASTGAAQYLEYDATCYANDSNYAAIQQGVAATAKIDFLMNGVSYVCSGTLLNDRGSTGTPWFATANHCIPTQTVANTITFRWHYEATTCGGSSTDSRATQTFGGAQLLWSNVTYDAAFLKLNSPPGAHTYFSGWNPNSLVVGEHVYGIHHPEGDHAMVSEGTVTALDASGRSINTGLSLTLNTVRYTHGGTEEGSSGSGVFSTPGGSLYWQGALFGGLPSNYQDANYGPFDNFYSNVRQYLDYTTQPGSANSSNALADCLFNWAEITYRSLFFPANTGSLSFGLYYFRFYSGTNSYLALSSADNNVKYLGPLSSNSMLDLGPATTWYATARCTQTTLDTQSPTVPTGLRATAVSSGQISLAWTASTDNVSVTAYKIYRNGTLTQTLANVTSFSDTGLAASTTYSYAVSACDAAGNCSAQSTSASASTSPAESVNRTNAARLVGGTWTFTYTIISAFTDTYTFTSVDPTPNASGDYFAIGTGAYGRHVAGSYYSPGNIWDVLDTGSIIDRFFTFTFTDDNHISGCYYQINPPGSTHMSRCYAMYGVRTVGSFAASASKPDADASVREVMTDNRPAFTDPGVVESYLQLRNQGR